MNSHRCSNLDVELWDGTVGIDIINTNKNSVTIMPNPFKESTTIHLAPALLTGKTSINMQITDITGRLVNSYLNIREHVFTLDSKGMGKGVYFLSVTSNQEEIMHGKLVVE